MTRFEAATLAVQQGSLELQKAGLELQQGQLWAAIAIPVVSGLVGLGQCWLIWLGIRRMGQASDQREKREDQRHAEAMRALDSQAEALRALVQGLERQGAALEAALKGGRA